MKKKQAFQLTIEQLTDTYNLNNIAKGLDSTLAQSRLEKHGPNKLTIKQVSKWHLFFRQFHNMIIYILLFSALLTLFMGHRSDALIIGIVVIVNALIGYYQEANASDALERIRELLSAKATVYRDGIRQDILAEELVLGDLVFLEAGDKVPADLRIVEADNFRVQESSLTGETDSVEKTTAHILAANTPLAEQTNLAFASTTVTSGSGKGIVIAISQQTEIGKITTEVNQTAPRKTPLMQEINQLGKGITYVIMTIAIVLFVSSLFLETYPLSVLSLAVVTLIVGSIPEGLPATTSIVLAMGVSDMAKNKHTIVKTLPAVETLGSVDVVATDKTGTLTKNEMTIKELVFADRQYQVSGDGYQPLGQLLSAQQPAVIDRSLELFLEAGYEANDTVLVQTDDHWIINGEPTDGSFLTLYHKVFPYPQTPNYQELDFLPFDSDAPYMAKLVENQQGKHTLFIKGSPDKLVKMAQKRDLAFDEAYWNSHVRRLSAQGKRVVAVGYQHVKKTQTDITLELLDEGITLLGLAGIIDPPREEVIITLKEMNLAGVSVKMITGDHPLTAKAIAQTLGLAPKILAITGAELETLTPAEFKQAVLTNHVFARTTPQNKLAIIEALQHAGKVTAMIGDGVNDAPALKRADIGVAMGKKGTDVAKESADMILTDDNFGTMSVAIRESRRIYDNIKKSILFLLPTSFAEGLIIAFTMLMQKEMPLKPTQLLWINMVSAITIQFAFIFEPSEDGLMTRKPRQTGKALLSLQNIWQMAYVSVLIALISLIAYEWLLTQGMTQTVASTSMITIVVMSKIFYLFTIRTSHLVFSKSFFSNPKAFLISSIMIVLQVSVTYLPLLQRAFHTAPIPLLAWAMSLAAGLLILSISELDKMTNKRLACSK